ncbi:MAG: cytochrome c oxidase subunit II [Anaerolineae bacterium]
MNPEPFWSFLIAKSTMGRHVDALFWTLVLVTLAFSIPIVITLIYFVVKYRRRSPDEVPPQIHGSNLLEITWTGIPLLMAIGFFFFSARTYLLMTVPPANSMDIWVIGKQWMWKTQQPDGQWEINELHVPVDTPVRLTMTSQDVIHAFFVPAFRVQWDVLPDRFTTLWFTANQTGTYHLYCSVYCGTEHSQMVGWVTVMQPDDYEKWLAGGAAAAAAGGQAVQTPAQQGEQLFQQNGCVSCHQSGGGGIGPSLNGVFGSQVQLEDGSTATADETYVRESMLQPAAKIVKGYQNVMPSFQGRLTDEQIIALIAYIKSLK